ncbi:uncharacterized protein GGS25DRAFT_432634 [Hypoxylon fragiforme]|uniref:uncharacterized protein n=1 Tax=Hypoxylon fragiforme TaxID=63214 RepID=UPI0020C6EA6E|nr:uncharacterized protein GGS25DRAFT_432634 [Hypoxylon fragiforme]KAI2605489.1 hypothetical protein GGS25DRAFT_432634 [Hypoxylon fragiforme]
MQLSTIVATALLPLLAAAADPASTTTSTMTMTKYVTISKVSLTTSTYSANSTTFYAPTGTGAGTISSSIFNTPTTTTGADGTPTTVAPTVSPTIDNNSGAALSSVNVALAGLAGLVIAAFM